MINRHYLRSAVFGCEDSLVSTTGLIAGLSVGAQQKNLVVLAGIIAIVIEAISMGAGEFISDDTELELDRRLNYSPVIGGLIMFTAYLLSGLLPLSFVLLLPLNLALPGAITASLVGLFLLGYAKGKLVHVSPAKSGLKIFMIGGLATLAGLVIGSLLQL
jgi:VIT1/CCC1 family predicted Fe2+/Mn2+ transporter